MCHRTRRKGTILVVALGLLAALAIIGATVISLSRIDRFSSQKFRQAAEMDLAVEAGLTWLEDEMVNNYWDNNFWAKSSGSDYTRTTGVFDQPQTPGAHTHIAIVRPNTEGIITAVSNAFDPGMYRSSGGNSTGDWYSLPVMQNLPDPGKTDNVKHNVPDAWNASRDVTEMRFRASGNRTIEIALTMVDLCGRYNLNFHGDDAPLDMASGGYGQSYDDTGYYLTDIAPNYWESPAGGARNALSRFDRQNYRKVIQPTFGGRLGSALGPMNDDKTLNFFNPGRDRPFLADDLIELLLLRGTGRQTRLERALQSTLLRDGVKSGGGPFGGGADTMFYKALYTTHSWVSACRPRRIHKDEERLSDTLLVKADLDASNQEDLKAAILATGSFPDTPAGNKLADQILANILDFRDEDQKPTAIKGDNGSYIVYGVDRQPFLTEVYFEKQPPQNAQDPPDYVEYKVTIEMCNPYDTPLTKGESYTKITVGKGGNVTTFTADSDVPASIDKRPDDQPVRIENATGTIQVPRNEDPMGYLEPVQLFTRSEGDATDEIVIDRIAFDALPSNGESWQRLNRSGKDREGNATDFFAGWTAEQVQAVQTCSGGLSNPFNATTATKICKPIENRSLTKKDRSKKRYKPEELSFRCIGDLVRVLQVGPTVGPSAGTEDDQPVTEILAEKEAKDCYLDLLDDKLKRLIEVFTVNSPYYDGLDNDGDLIDTNNNGQVDPGEVGYDDTDTGFQTTSSGVPVDVLGPEIYQHGRINLLTAPPEVIRGMLPLQLKRRGQKLWTVARLICQFREMRLKTSPVDILNMDLYFPFYKGYDLFTHNDNTDDDGNGAPDDFAERFYLWTYMSNWATVRSDCFAVYGVARIKSAAGRTEGTRRFLTVLDRVPATAYPPFVWVSDSDHRLRPNPRFIPVRRVFTTGVD